MADNDETNYNPNDYYITKIWGTKIRDQELTLRVKALEEGGTEPGQGKIDDVKVNDKSVVKNRVAYIDTTALSDAVVAEKARAEKVEDDLSKALKVETERATVKENSLYDSINTEITKRESADKELDDKITVNANAIKAEETRATNRENALEKAIEDSVKVTDVTVDGNSVVSEKVAKIDLSPITNRVTAIEEKIVDAATKDNKLIDKQYVDDAITNNTATFRGTKNTLEELKALDGENNDYAFLEVIDETTGFVEKYDRYKCVVTGEGETKTKTWTYEFTLNNSSFTAEQWAAITSGITNTLVEQITTNKNNIATNTAAIEGNKNDIANEITRATNKEEALETSITEETERAKTKETELEEAIKNAGKINDVTIDGVSIVSDKVASFTLDNDTEKGLFVKGVEYDSAAKAFTVKRIDEASDSTNNVNVKAEVVGEEDNQTSKLTLTADEVIVNKGELQATNNILATTLQKDDNGTKKELLKLPEGYKDGDNTLVIKDDLYHTVTYAELVELRDSSKLIKGATYRITDYECSTSIINTKAAKNLFDILVIADDVNKLNENARAIKHEDDGSIPKVKWAYGSEVANIDDILFVANQYTNEDTTFDESHKTSMNAAAWTKFEDNKIYYDRVQEFAENDYLVYKTVVEYNSGYYGKWARYEMTDDGYVEKGSCLLNVALKDNKLYYIIKNYDKEEVNDLSEITWYANQIIDENQGDLSATQNSHGLADSFTSIDTTNNTIKYTRTDDLQDYLSFKDIIEFNGQVYGRWVRHENDGSDNYSTADGYALLNVLVEDNKIYKIIEITYPTILDCKFEGWELKYCLDNDYTRFAWAACDKTAAWEICVEDLWFTYQGIVYIDDVEYHLWYNSKFTPQADSSTAPGYLVTVDAKPAVGAYGSCVDEAFIMITEENYAEVTSTRKATVTTGKGVIYYLKDEFNNEAPYDFKNIMFKRYACNMNPLYRYLDWDETSYIMCESNNPTMATKQFNYVWAYTFTKTKGEVLKANTVVYDASLREPLTSISTEYWNKDCYNNVIKPRSVTVTYDEDVAYIAQTLNDIVLMDASEINTTDSAVKIFNNSFDYGCHNITLVNHSYMNTFGKHNYGIVFIRSNNGTFGDANHTIFNGGYRNNNFTLGSANYNLNLYNCIDITIGSNNNTFEMWYVKNSSFGNANYNIYFGKPDNLIDYENIVIGSVNNTIRFDNALNYNAAYKDLTTKDVTVGNNNNNVYFKRANIDCVLGDNNIAVTFGTNAKGCIIGNNNNTITINPTINSASYAYDNSYNIIGNYNNTIYIGASSGASSQYNIIGNYNKTTHLDKSSVNNNTIGNNNNNINMNASCHGNTIGSYCGSITLGVNSYCNDIEDRCQNISFGSSSYYNSVSSCVVYANLSGSSNVYNKIDSNAHISASYGDIKYNIFGANCKVSLGLKSFYNNTVEAGAKVSIVLDETSGTTGAIQGYTFSSDLQSVNINDTSYREVSVTRDNDHFIRVSNNTTEEKKISIA